VQITSPGPSLGDSAGRGAYAIRALRHLCLGNRIGRLETEGPLGLRPVGLGSACADEGVLNMHTAAFVTVYLFGVWESLRDQVLLDRAHFHLCIESNNESNNTDCAAVSTLMKIVEEARQNQGKALLGHLNRSINLMIKAAPGDWTGPLEAITMRNGDCKSYSIAKYAAVRAAGFSADHVRLVTVHDRRYHFDHMVVAAYYNEEWLILDNLTNLLVRDTEKNDYEPTAVLDYKSARRYRSAFWMTD